MNFVSPAEIAKVLNLPAEPQTLDELDFLVAQGFPKESLRFSIDQIYTHTDDRNRLLYSIVPEATYKRRRERLSPEESGRAERLARVVATANYVWDDADDARAFLTTSHALLKGRKPIDVAMTELGAVQVIQLLWRLFYGVAA
jgi:putative toxin-antitoxin system antitoxin component (TIGR02293 family)